MENWIWKCQVSLYCELSQNLHGDPITQFLVHGIYMYMYIVHDVGVVQTADPMQPYAFGLHIFPRTKGAYSGY